MTPTEKLRQAERELAQKDMTLAGTQMENKQLRDQMAGWQARLEKAEKDAELKLDPNDVFERAVIDIVQMNRRKRADYATEGNIFANFEKVADALGLSGYDALEDMNTMVIRKTARIINLRGRDPLNESVQDSYLDRAVYAVLAYAYLKKHSTLPEYLATENMVDGWEDDED